MEEKIFYKNLIYNKYCENIEIIIMKYNILNFNITIGYNDDNEIVYCVKRIENKSLNSDTLEDNKLMKIINNIKFKQNNNEKIEIDEIISNNLIKKYKEIYVLLRDENIEEIALNGPALPIAVVHRKLPIGWIKTNIIVDEETADDLVLLLARHAGRNISIAHPYAEGLLPEGHRVAITYAREVSRHGSSFVVRKHISHPLPPTTLIKQGIMTPLVLAYLWEMIEEKKSILIVGPTAAGKTTLLQSLLLLISPYKRIVTIEDTPELNLDFHPHWDALVTRHTYIEGEGEDIDLYKLAKFSLRRRADYIVIGEIRGEEAKLLSYAATSGHGVLATFHAESVDTALERLAADPFNLRPGQIASISVIVAIGKVKPPKSIAEKRRILEVSEIKNTGNKVYSSPVFTYNVLSDSLTPLSVSELSEKSEYIGNRLDNIRIKYNLIKSMINDNYNFINFYEKIKDYYNANVFKVVSRLEEAIEAGKSSKIYESEA